ncbi:uncharacterized protein LOC100372160 [Saccoglossus kowalevskii]
MSGSGADNNMFIVDERGPPPSYPGTPTSFIRITPSVVIEEQLTVNEKNVPGTFVEVPQTGPSYALPNYIDHPTSVPPGENITIIETNTVHLTKTSKKVSATPGVTCGDISVLLLSIVALILFLPLGLPAVVLSGLAIGHRRGNNGLKAAKYTKISIALSFIGIGIFAIIATVCIVKHGTSTDDDCDHERHSSNSESRENADCGDHNHNDSIENDMVDNNNNHKSNSDNNNELNEK